MACTSDLLYVLQPEPAKSTPAAALELPCQNDEPLLAMQPDDTPRMERKALDDFSPYTTWDVGRRRPGPGGERHRCQRW